MTSSLRDPDYIRTDQLFIQYYNDDRNSESKFTNTFNHLFY